MIETTIISVSQNAVVRAESAIEGCSECVPEAKVRFWQVVDDLRNHSGAEVIYILPTLASCPNCRARIDEMTLVVPKTPSGAGIDAPLVQSRA